MEKKYLVENTSLTGLTAWLNINKNKGSGKSFTVGDVRQYIHVTGKIPDYLGGNEIKINKAVNFTKETYNLLK